MAEKGSVGATEASGIRCVAVGSVYLASIGPNRGGSKCWGEISVAGLGKYVDGNLGSERLAALKWQAELDTPALSEPWFESPAHHPPQ